jgi:hypothetical protein
VDPRAGLDAVERREIVMKATNILILKTSTGKCLNEITYPNFFPTFLLMSFV